MDKHIMLGRLTVRFLAPWTLAALLTSACGEDGKPAPVDGSLPPGETDAGEQVPACQGEEGCACADDAPCVQGLLCDARELTCRAPLTCEQLACELYQECVPGEQGGDAHCGECSAGYRWDAVEGKCEAVAGCDDSLPGAIVQRCAAENRSCDDRAGEARCGECLVGSTLVDGRCVAENCSKLVCTEPQACVSDDDGASCAGCVEGYEWSDTAGRCLKQCSALTCKSGEHCVESDGMQPAQCARACDEGRVYIGQGVCLECTA